MAWFLYIFFSSVFIGLSFKYVLVENILESQMQLLLFTVVNTFSLLFSLFVLFFMYTLCNWALSQVEFKVGGGL